VTILTIARLTLREASRRRLLLTVAILTVMMVGFTGWGFSRLSTLSCGENYTPCPPTEVMAATSVLLILVAYMFNSILAMGSVFIAAPSIAGEIETGVMLAVLPRPIRRSEIVLGKWLGLSALVAAYTVITGVLEFFVVKLVSGYTPPHPIQALVYLAGEAIIILTLAILISTRLAPMAGGVIAVVVFGMAWIAGIAETIGIAFQNTVLVNVGVVMSLLLPTDALWRGTIFYMEPTAIIALGSQAGRSMSGNPFFVSAPPPNAYIAWAFAWIVVVLGLAVFSFNRRDL
jgi:ABC-type transport system involved in multi-copper enzyme maturation permease subunit